MAKLKIAEFNDSFPPTIDGVAQTVKNYATHLQKHCDVTVATPAYRGVKDEYPFEVIRYPSIPMEKQLGYRAGNPFDPEVLLRLRKKKFDLIHVHAPFASSVLASNVKMFRKTPVVLTYHTKFEQDIQKRVSLRGMQKIALNFVLANINAADEVWCVTEGCGQALRNIGYEGSYMVMENGTDFPRGVADPAAVDALREKYNVHPDEFVFLYVGRMMWYKNIQISMDALRLAKDQGLKFKFFLVGSGTDLDDMQQYADDIGLSDEVICTGPVYDREELRVFYGMSDMFLFPSTFDTSGIVVKEAAACNCPSLLVKGSCAAERAVHNESAFLTEENAIVCSRVILAACQDRAHIKEVGETAGRELYLSWETVVERAYRRYEQILETWPGPLPYNSKHR